MGSPWRSDRWSLPHEAAAGPSSDDNAVAACALRIESKFSRYRDRTTSTRDNTAAGGTGEVDDKTTNLLDFAALMHVAEGLFDILGGIATVGGSFEAATRAGPIRDESFACLSWDGKRCAGNGTSPLPPGIQIDFGGIGKEYAVDPATQTGDSIVRRRGAVNSAAISR